MDECVQIIPIYGFDAAGKPEIRMMGDGTLRVLFNFVPPLDVRDDEERLFETFEEHLSHAAGVPVIREDREVFLVRSPTEGTIERLAGFLEHCRRAKAGRAAKPSVRGVLYDGLTALFTPHGFKLRKGDQAFVRALPAGKQKLFVGWIATRSMSSQSPSLCDRTLWRRSSTALPVWPRNSTASQ